MELEFYPKQDASVELANVVRQHLGRPCLPLTALDAVSTCHSLPDTLVALISGFLTPKSWTIVKACALGSIQLLQCLIALEKTSSHPLYRAHVFTEALNECIRHDNAMELIECLHAYCPTGFAGKGMAEAACLGKVDVMEWLFVNHANLVWSQDYVTEATKGGHLGVLRWLKGHYSEIEDYLADAIAEAACGGHLAGVKWLYDNVAYEAVSAETEIDTICRAIEQGDLDMLKYLRGQLRHTLG